jgi:hypothetical protein
MRRVGLLAEELRERYICPKCGKEYKSAVACKAHVTKEHTQGPEEGGEVHAGD